MNQAVISTYLIGPIILGFSLFFNSCSTKGAANLLIPLSDEEKLGAEFHAQLKAKPDSFPVFKAKTKPDSEFVDYMKSVFNSVLHSVPQDDMPEYQEDFTFTIIDQDIQNAFAVPGGFIYIYTGIIKEFQDESELAGVLAHEIAHVTQRHYARTVIKRAGYSFLLDALLGDENQLSQYIKGVFGYLSGTYVIREHEEEADEYGTIYLQASDRNPRGIASFFNRLSAKEEGGWHPEMLSTHPKPKKRVNAVNEQVDKKIKSDENWKKYDVDEYKYEDKFNEKTAVLRK